MAKITKKQKTEIKHKETKKEIKEKPQKKITQLQFEKDIIDHIKASKIDVDIGFLPNVNANVSHWLDTGSYTWNFISSGNLKKGIPFGRVVEVFGESGSGKSLMCSQLACMCNILDFTSIYVDTELAFTDDFARRLGADPEKIINVTGMKTIEKFDQYFNAIVARVKEARKKGNDKPVAVFLDSMAMLSSDHEIKEPNKVDYTKLKKIRQFFRVYMDDCHRHNIMLFVVNQIYDKIGVMFGEKTAATGGHGVGFASSIRFNLRAPKILKAEAGNSLSDPMSTVVKAKTIKNRVSIPERSAFIVSSYSTGVDRYGGLFELLFDGKWHKSQYKEATHLNVIQKAKKDGQYCWPGVMVDDKGKDIIFKRDEFEEIFKQKEDFYIDELQKVIDEKKNKIEPDRLDREEQLLVGLEDADSGKEKEILAELEKIQEEK